MLQSIKKYSDYSWFCRRYVELVIDFPKELTHETLDLNVYPKVSEIQTVIEALKVGHAFLYNITHQLAYVSPQDQKAVFDIFLKIDLLWFLGIFGQLEQDDHRYYITFVKSTLTGTYKYVKTAPESFMNAFVELAKAGCDIHYYHEGRSATSYRSCDSGVVRFPDPLCAQGIWLFVQAIINQPIPAQRYRKHTNPVVQFANKFYQIDMRLFLREECRPSFNIDEILAGYSQEAKERFHIMYDFVAEHYPECLPISYEVYDYIMSGVGFAVDEKHRMLGSLTVGDAHESIIFYSAMVPETIRERILKEVDFSGMANASSCGDWHRILTNEGAENAVKIMDIHAKYNKNAGIKAR